MPQRDLEFGLDTFIPVTVDQSGRPVGGDQVIRNTVEEAVLAEAAGVDSFNIGEHYRPEFMDSAGHVILAAIAGRTEKIRLGTAVTVLSTNDPVRLYADFATLDAVSDALPLSKNPPPSRNVHASSPPLSMPACHTRRCGAAEAPAARTSIVMSRTV